ncbi:glucosylglycerol-phosphate synthase [Phaeobacter sp. 22II1-1F12B]|uniref:glucosylglycerol-phosphate synthase n=1 Tax=Phaeobacter sp. 22II1-1F12B TaxID=1317111 RepID=UPI000B52830D|nr:glucosylglycerol-phosphate synthase [Phaeobacter sp. 22II1-1F12B]OWU78968.1 glucosylglycerol-phosphate synthase [Phaeobacter sp. 22II1-1F12B]
MSSDLVIVYHRQPYEEVEENGVVKFRENKSPNGIVPTLKSFFATAEKASWIAWKLADDPSNPDFEKVVEIDDQYGKYNVSRLPLTYEQVSSFYHVSSKEAFWPILHSFKEKFNYDPVDWPTFREVNWAFAEAAAREAAQGARVWIHDYNLWLVPGYLRTLRSDVTISFFHHTPFPAADMFNVLPWRREIVGSLLACDIVGFHIARYASNFVSVAQSLFDVDVLERHKVDPEMVSDGTALSERSYPKLLSYEGRKVAISSANVGVNPDFIEARATDAEVQKNAREIREDMGDCKLILSVGRTDYTKGGVDQLESFERVLADNPELRGKVKLMHVSVSADRNMSAYAPVQTGIEETAGRINGRYGTLRWQPVALISRAIPFDDLIKYYLAADVAWITPLVDGMNLVCKEFCAARVDGDGVLVLSEFAGAAVELHSAVITNPFSHRSMDSAILSALDMPEEERRHRMKTLRSVVKKFTVAAWGEAQQREFDAAVERKQEMLEKQE